MDNNDFIREIKNFMDSFFAEWLILNNEYEKSIAKDLEEMEEQDSKNDLIISRVGYQFKGGY